jgi:hypothetical protein
MSGFSLQSMLIKLSAVQHLQLAREGSFMYTGLLDYIMAPKERPFQAFLGPWAVQWLFTWQGCCWMKPDRTKGAPPGVCEQHFNPGTSWWHAASAANPARASEAINSAQRQQRCRPVKKFDK